LKRTGQRLKVFTAITSSNLADWDDQIDSEFKYEKPDEILEVSLSYRNTEES